MQEQMGGRIKNKIYRCYLIDRKELDEMVKLNRDYLIKLSEQKNKIYDRIKKERAKRF